MKKSFHDRQQVYKKLEYNFIIASDYPLSDLHFSYEIQLPVHD